MRVRAFRCRTGAPPAHPTLSLFSACVFRSLLLSPPHRRRVAARSGRDRRGASSSSPPRYAPASHQPRCTAARSRLRQPPACALAHSLAPHIAPNTRSREMSGARRGLPHVSARAVRGSLRVRKTCSAPHISDISSCLTCGLSRPGTASCRLRIASAFSSTSACRSSA